MRIAYFDIISGISGDMTLGAFVDAGVPIEVLQAELGKLPLTGYSLSKRIITRSMICATKVDINLAPDSDDGHEHIHRSYISIRDLIDGSDLHPEIRNTAIKIFHVIAVAEAKLHGTTVEEVHFHEVGAVDSIVDIVGIAICMNILKIEKVYSTVVKTGRNGIIQTQHGKMPIPTPATMEILKGYPVVLTDVAHELTTPTGAGFITAMSEGMLRGGEILRIESIGYGAGSKEIADVPNMLRVFIGTQDEPLDQDEVIVLETNIDNMNPQVYPFIMERALAEGALDVFLTPILMKKGRTGNVLSLLCTPERSERLMRFLLRETTTTGVRMHATQRRKAPREIRRMDTSLGMVTVKIIERFDRREFVPEYEDCRRIAEEKNIPILEVYEILMKQLHT